MPVVLDGFAAEEALLDPEMRGAARWRQTMNAGGQRRGGWPRPPGSGWPRGRRGPARMSQTGLWRDSELMTATDARLQLHRLQVERLDAVETGLGEKALYMTDLENDIALSRVAFVALAVTEIASFRAQLSGPDEG